MPPLPMVIMSMLLYLHVHHAPHTAAAAARNARVGSLEPLHVNFRNEEDYLAFAKLIDQALTDKSKSIWYPKLDVEENSLNRWIVE